VVVNDSGDDRNIPAEQQVLGAMMAMPDSAIPTACAILTRGEFARPGHQLIWDAILDLYGRGAPTGPVAVHDQLLQMMPGRDRRGGVDGPYLHTLLEVAPLRDEVGHYAGIVRAAYRVRRRRELGKRLQQSGTDMDAIAAELAELAADAPARRAGVVAVSAAGMRMKAAVWLADQRIPVGAITLLGGREGIGKSTIAYDYAARVTRGALAGYYQGTARAVGVVATEDDWQSVILPRLVAARADRSRIFRLEARTDDGRYETISVPAHLDELAKVCAERDIVLIIVDPIMSVIHGSLDTHKDREVRRALDPLNRFAGESGVSVLALIHVNKSNGTDPLNSIMASKAFTAVARSVLYCIADPEDDDQYLFGHPKSNLGPKQPTLVYRIVEAKVEQDDQDEHVVIGTSRVRWEGQDERSIRDAMEPDRPKRPAGEVAARILAFLQEQVAPVSVGTIAAELSDVKRNTLKQNLTRLVQRREIVRPFRDHYALPPRPSDTRRHARDSVTGVTTVTSPGPSDASDSSDAKDVSREVSLPLSPDCPGCGWSLDSNAHAINCGSADAR
jgi:hypothetical protein